MTYIRKDKAEIMLGLWIFRLSGFFLVFLIPIGGTNGIAFSIIVDLKDIFNEMQISTAARLSFVIGAFCNSRFSSCNPFKLTGEYYCHCVGKFVGAAPRFHGRQFQRVDFDERVLISSSPNFLISPMLQMFLELNIYGLES